MGRAPITDCNVGTVAGGTCERDTEGSADLARYGGSNSADNSGQMSFVQIRYSGFVLGAGRELQALTTEGIGSARCWITSSRTTARMTAPNSSAAQST